MLDVTLVRWPKERHRLDQLRRQRVPRLVLVDAQEAPPAPTPDTIEDWVRLPIHPSDVRARVATLQLRAIPEREDAPEVDTDGLVTFRGRTQVLPPVESRLTNEMVERWGAVVRRDCLMRAAWPGADPARNTLDTHMVRLRRRLAVVGLGVRTVRSRGYMLVVSDSVQTAVS
jgi:DNA-binding response OmpR family regulator